MELSENEDCSQSLRNGRKSIHDQRKANTTVTQKAAMRQA